MSNDGHIIEGINNYYTDKITRYGNTPCGVDWNSKDSQYLRFDQLTRIIRNNNNFSLLDYGCGYGELSTYLENKFPGCKINYTGYDISAKMISEAKSLHGNDKSTNFTSDLPIGVFDYCIASGIFNVKLELADNDVWLKYIISVLNDINQHASKAFSFNALTMYSDKEFMKDYLYYTDPLLIFNHCKHKYSRNIALLHDYDLYEFTMLIRKNG